MKLRKPLFRRRTVESNEGGILANGPFTVRIAGGKLMYSEGTKRLTLPVEIGLDGSPTVGTFFLRRWDSAAKSDRFTKTEEWQVERNIFAALDFMRFRYTNSR